MNDVLTKSGHNDKNECSKIEVTKTKFDKKSENFIEFLT